MASTKQKLTKQQREYQKRAAQVQKAWEAADGEFLHKGERGNGRCVRLLIVPDDNADLDFLLGDTYNPEVNTDIPAEQLKAEEKAEIDRINREGVYGIIAEYWNGEEWEQVESCWGFVGDDWKGSGYDIDFMSAALKAWDEQKHCPTCKRPSKG